MYNLAEIKLELKKTTNIMLRLFHQLKGIKHEYGLTSKRCTEALLAKDKITNKFRNLIVGDDRLAMRRKIDEEMLIIEGLLPRLTEWDYMIRKKTEIIARYTGMLKAKDVETNNRVTKMRAEEMVKNAKLKRGKKFQVVVKEEKAVETVGGEHEESENAAEQSDDNNDDSDDDFNDFIAPVEAKRYVPSMHKEILEKSKYRIGDIVRSSIVQKRHPLISVHDSYQQRQSLSSTIVDLTSDLAGIIDDKSLLLSRSVSKSTVERVKTAIRRIRSDIQKRVSMLIPDPNDVIPDGTGMTLTDRNWVRGSKLTPWGGKSYPTKADISNADVSKADTASEANGSLPSSLIEYNFVNQSLEIFNDGIVDNFMLNDSDDSSDNESELEYGNIFYPTDSFSLIQ